jgi:hypothetical protein
VKFRRALLVVLAVFVAAGCQVRTVVTVDVEDDGSGVVTVAVGLDAEALAKVPDLDGDGAGDTADLTGLVRVEDLKAAGWTVGEPSAAPDADGFVWMKATKPFGTPEEASSVLAELTGPDGGLRNLVVTRSTGFGRTKYSFSGTADLSAGLEAFGDQGLAAALDGEPLGEDAAAIEQRFGKPLSELVTLTIDVNLPGGKSGTWHPELGGDPTPMSIESQILDRLVLALAVLSVSSLIALVVILLTRRRTAG